MNREEFLAQWRQGRRDFNHAILLDTDLRGLDLSGIGLGNAYLQGANLQGADLRCADLRGANLQRADLQRATLQRAELRGADLYGANLQGALLTRADLRGAIVPITCINKNMSGISLNDSTVFVQDGFFPDQSGQFHHQILQGKELLEKLSGRESPSDPKQISKALVDFIVRCDTSPESAEAQIFYRHALWTQVECVMLSGDKIDAYIPYGTSCITTQDEEHLEDSPELLRLHGPKNRPARAQVNPVFWQDNNFQSNDTHFVRIVPPHSESSEDNPSLLIQLKPLQEMPEDIQKALREEAQKPGTQKNTSIRGLSVQELLCRAQWTEEDKEALGISEAPASEDHTASDQAQDVASTSATATQEERFFDGPAHSAPTQGSTQSGGKAPKK